MKNPDLTRWLLKVRDALAEPDETTRNSMLRAADRFLKRNNQSLTPGGTGMDKVQTRESRNQFVQPQRAVVRARN